MTTYRYDPDLKKVVECEPDRRERTQAVKPTIHNIVSRALPKRWKYADSYDGKGRPTFRSKRHVDECVARAQDHGEPVVFDD